MIEIITINIQNISKLVRSFLCVRTETKNCRISKPLNWNTHECHLSIIVQISKFPLPRVSKNAMILQMVLSELIYQKKKKKIFPAKCIWWIFTWSAGRKVLGYTEAHLKRQTHQ